MPRMPHRLRDGFVRIHHPELDVTSEVPVDTVPTWEDKGWQLVDAPGITPVVDPAPELAASELGVPEPTITQIEAPATPEPPKPSSGPRSSRTVPEGTDTPNKEG